MTIISLYVLSDTANYVYQSKALRTPKRMITDLLIFFVTEKIPCRNWIKVFYDLPTLISTLKPPNCYFTNFQFTKDFIFVLLFKRIFLSWFYLPEGAISWEHHVQMFKGGADSTQSLHISKLQINHTITP